MLTSVRTLETWQLRISCSLPLPLVAEKQVLGAKEGLKCTQPVRESHQKLYLVILLHHWKPVTSSHCARLGYGDMGVCVGESGMWGW